MLQWRPPSVSAWPTIDTAQAAEQERGFSQLPTVNRRPRVTGHGFRSSDPARFRESGPSEAINASQRE
jgi:hypothetical protein